MALSYNLGYQESILVHPTRRPIFAGNHTRLSPTSENESYLHLSFFIPGHPLCHTARLLVGPHGTRDDCTAPKNPNDLVLAFQLQLLMQSIPTEAPIIRLMQALLWF